MINHERSGYSFLHHRNPSLHASEEVELSLAYMRPHMLANGEAYPTTPIEKVAAHIAFLADVALYDVLAADVRSEYHTARMMAGEEDKYSRRYIESIAHSRNVRLSSDDNDSAQEELSIRQTLLKAERATIGQWIRTLQAFPDWFRLYALEGLYKLGNSKPSDDPKVATSFNRRTAGTYGQLQESRPELLGRVYSWIHLAHIDGEYVEGPFGPNATIHIPEREQTFQHKLTVGNFAELYAEAFDELHVARPIPAALLQRKEGSWLQFGNSEAGIKELQSLCRGYKNEWCVGGAMGSARFYLAKGDLYVYATSDECGRDRVPRVAVVREGGEVTEVRGILPNQHIDAHMLPLVQDTMRMTGVYWAEVASRDMMRLNAIADKLNSSNYSDLTEDELRFIFELDREITSFGLLAPNELGEVRSASGKAADMVARHIYEQRDVAAYTYTELYSMLPASVAASNRPIDIPLFNKLFDKTYMRWLERGVFSQMGSLLLRSAQESQFQLVAVPNIPMTNAGVMAAMHNMGTLLRGYDIASLNVLDGILPLMSGELCGHEPEAGPVRFLAFPRTANTLVRMSTKQEVLGTITKTRCLKLPSLLDAIGYWVGLVKRGYDFRQYNQDRTDVVLGGVHDADNTRCLRARIDTANKKVQLETVVSATGRFATRMVYM